MSIGNSANAIISLLQQRLPAQGNFDISLVPGIVPPGLTATAGIKTDERRVIDYLLSLLERRVSEAGRER